MKKILLVITMLLCIGCEQKGYTELSINEFFNKIDNKENFVIVLGSDTCSACQAFQQTMKKVINNENIEIFYLDFDKLSEEEYSKVYSKFVVTSTPTTVFLKDGAETSTYDRIIGTLDYKDIVKKLEKLGYIGE